MYALEIVGRNLIKILYYRNLYYVTINNFAESSCMARLHMNNKLEKGKTE